MTYFIPASVDLDLSTVLLFKPQFFIKQSLEKKNQLIKKVLSLCPEMKEHVVELKPIYNVDYEKFVEKLYDQSYESCSSESDCLNENLSRIMTLANAENTEPLETQNTVLQTDVQIRCSSPEDIIESVESENEVQATSTLSIV